MSKILRGLNEVNAQNYDSDIDYYNALNRKPRGRSEDDFVEPEDPYQDMYRKQDAEMAKYKKEVNVQYVNKEGSAPNGERYNGAFIVRAKTPYQGDNEIYKFNDAHWGAKKIVDTVKKQPDEQGEPYTTIVYYVDNHKHGYWKPWKDEPPISKGVEFTEEIMREGISQEDLADLLFHRLELRYPDIVKRYGHEVVGDIVLDVAGFHEGAEELGTSDIGIMLRQIMRKLEDYANEQINELSPQTLASYKTKAGADASKSDRLAQASREIGDTEMAQKLTNRANKRFSGMVRATNKQFDNDAKGIKEDDFEESYYDRGDYYNAKVGGEYGRNMRPQELDSAEYVSRDGDGPRGRPAKVRGVSDKLPADPFGRTSGAAPKDIGVGKIHRIAGPGDEIDEDLSEEQLDELKCWPGYTRVRGVPAGAPGSCKKKTNEEAEQCPECGGPMFSDLILAEKKDACYHKVRSRYKVWPSAYASGALVQCRKKGASNWGNGGKKNESVEEEQVDENLRKWFKEKWVRFGPDGKIRGACARGDDSEGKPKCLPQSKAHSLGKKGRASAAARKRREDPNPERTGKAINVNTKKKSNEDVAESYTSAIGKAMYLALNKEHEGNDDMRMNEINEDWQKVNKKDKTDGMSRKAVKAYRRENPGSKLKTAVTTKPSKLKKGSKAAKRRKSFCARMKGMKKAHASAKTKRNPDSPINKALRRWNCESVEQLHELMMIAEQKVQALREAANPAQQAAIAISMKKKGQKPKSESAIEKGIVDENLGMPNPGTYEQETAPIKRKGQQERVQSIAFESKK